MIIAIISQEYPPATARGGLGSQNHTKATGLAALGHRVFVISRSINGQRQEKMEDGVHVIRIPGMESTFPEMTLPVQWLTHSVAIAAEIESLHQRERLDLVDFPEWGAEGYIFLLNQTEWRHIPAVIQLHGPLVMFGEAMGWPDKADDFYQVGTHMEATCVRLADAVYSSSACSAGWIRKHYDSSRSEIPVIHLGVNTQIFHPLQVEKDPYPSIVFLGRLVHNKGVEELLVALFELKVEFPTLTLRLVGDGDKSYLQHLRKMVKEAGAEHWIMFNGFTPPEAIPEVFSRSHLFVAPSHYEGGPGFVYLEAMACGLPVVGCSGSGVEEVISDGVTGRLAPPGNAAMLAVAIRDMLADRSSLEAMGQKAREYVVDNADSAYCVGQVEAFYESVISRISQTAAHL